MSVVQSPASTYVPQPSTVLPKERHRDLLGILLKQTAYNMNDLAELKKEVDNLKTKKLAALEGKVRLAAIKLPMIHRPLKLLPASNHELCAFELWYKKLHIILQ